MSEKNKDRCALAYVLIGIFTFGYSYNHNFNKECPEANGMIAAVSAVGWPLYWSQRVFEPLRK